MIRHDFNRRHLFGFLVAPFLPAPAARAMKPVRNPPPLPPFPKEEWDSRMAAITEGIRKVRERLDAMPPLPSIIRRDETR